MDVSLIIKLFSFLLTLIVNSVFAEDETSWLDSCFAPPSLCFYLLLIPAIAVMFTLLGCTKWMGYMFFKYN